MRQREGTKRRRSPRRQNAPTCRHRRPQVARKRAPAPGEPTSASTAPTTPTAGRVRTSRADTKQAKLVAMLRRPDGASLDEIVAVTGWQKHTVRGAIAGALKKKLGLAITSGKAPTRGTVYRIAG